MLLWILESMYLSKLGVWGLVFIYIYIYTHTHTYIHTYIYIPRSRISGLYSSSTFGFWEASMLFSTVAEPIYIPTNSVWGVLFLYILANICYLRFFGESHSDRCKVRFWFAFPWWLVMWNIFSCACWPSACPLWKKSIQDLYPFFNQFCFFVFLCWVSLAVYIFWILTPYWSYHLHMIFGHIFPVHRLS